MATSLFRCMTRQRSSVAHFLFRPTTRRTFGSSHVVLVEHQAIPKNAPPPKASAPRPEKRGSSKLARNVRNRRYQKGTANKKAPRGEARRPPSTSSWVLISNIPPLSTLQDILNSINRVLDAQAGSIVDLDAPWKGGGQVTMLGLPSDDPAWVRSARLVLSSHGTPSGWRIEFVNRSVANAFLESSRANQFFCAWKPVTVQEWQKESNNDEEDAIQVSDSMIRVENVSESMTVDHVRHLFRRYDFTRDGLSVRVLNEKTAYKMFLVHFADPSWARAAIRELQGVRVHNDFLRLAQYPKQMP